MSRPLIALCLAAVLLTVVGAPTVHAAPPAGVTVTIDRTKVSSALGRTFKFSAKVANGGATATPPLVAQLDVLSLDPDTYVDPEDWSGARTRYLGSLPARGSRTIEWEVKAVNSGSFGVFVGVLPQSGAPAQPVTGPTLRVDIAERRTLNSGGILPLALGIPALLGALALGLRVRRRRA
jgi:hypothetical protein